jgi:putative nucleotidyltransferase with HDIG domain
VKRGIRLKGISEPVKSRVWSNDQLLRAGRLAALEIVLDDSSVSRKHAEVRSALDGIWTVRDLHSTNGTYVNGVRVPPGQDHPLKARDVVQFGKIAVMVELSEGGDVNPPSDNLILAASLSASSHSPAPGSPAAPSPIFAGPGDMPRAGEQLLALLRASHHQTHLQNEDQLLDNILNDAVSVLDAQRGAIVLADGDGPAAQLRLRKMAVGPGEIVSRSAFSKRLTQKAFEAGDSMLFTNVHESAEFQQNVSIVNGAMASVLCVILRTPRLRLGVLHLDRGPLQAPFTTTDLHLADALAAHVSAGIECSQLLRRQRDLFQQTIEMLANVVEMRDDYTGLHTKRVTRYSLMLAEKLELPDDQLELIRIGAPLHDIGKIAISDTILRKPGKLTPAEFADMQSHTVRGAEYLAGIPDLQPIIPIVRNHHERWNGTGYPDRLRGEEIPYLARIVAVCDAYDAMTSNRPYHPGQKGRPPGAAFADIHKQAGFQFDPRCAAAFLDIRADVVEAMYDLMPDARRDDEAGPATANLGSGPRPLPPAL